MGARMKQALLAFVVCGIGLPWSGAAAQEGRVIPPDGPDAAVQLVLQSGVAKADASEVLQVFVGPPEACCTGKSPIAGDYAVDGRTVTFHPAFDFISGQMYTVQSGQSPATLTPFTIAADSDVPAPEVVAIYPSGDTIPENTLRFYIQFSAPMSPHRVDDFITLVDAQGKADRQAFMSFSQELWNEDRTQLTLLMDPGRIKRGVAQNLTLGPALREGNRYSIVVGEGWPAARAGQRAPRFEKSFKVSAPLRRLPDVDLWQFLTPRQTTNDSLGISFDRPFDQQLAKTAITVFGDDARKITGTVLVEDHEQTWRFQPDEPWATSTVRIAVDAHLEDVAGNNFKDLLDHAVGTRLQVSDQKNILLKLKAIP